METTVTKHSAGRHSAQTSFGLRLQTTPRRSRLTGNADLLLSQVAAFVLTPLGMSGQRVSARAEECKRPRTSQHAGTSARGQ